MYQKQSKETIKIKKLIVVFFACIFLISTLSICAFAATVTVSEETSISMDDILNSEVVSTLKVVVVTLVNPIAAASMSMALFGLAFSSGQKQTEKKDYVKEEKTRILVARLYRGSFLRRI